MSNTYKLAYLSTSVFIVFLLFNTVTVNAQEKQLKLDDLKKKALQYSRSIKNDSLLIKKAEFVKQEAFDNYFPEVSANAFAVQAFDYLVPEIPTYLPDGIENIYSVGATATQAVYAGGKVRLGNKLAELQLEARKIGHETTIDSVMFNTELKFWQLIQLQEQQKVLQAGKTYVNELLKQQQDLLDAGLISESQMLQVNVEKSNILVNELELANFRKIALLDLALYVGIPFDTTMVATSSINEEAFSSAILDNNLTIDLASNNLYQLSQKQVSAAELQVKNEKSNLLPQVAVGVNAVKVGTFNNAFDMDIQPIAFGTVTIPISAFWGKEKKKIRQKEVDLQIAENNLHDVEDQLTKYITKNWYDLQTANKQIQYAKDKLTFANKNLEAQRDNYNSGLNNLTDLLNARQTQEEAEASLISAIANFKQKEATYLYSTNQIEIPVLD
ncbi:TolC family protein [Neotamlana laminarinivorans]|uniref:TolC family protein n=1 Tax=Neotamlana laminarinivorans TaxID=2883124 RepID=A0A9X1I0H3_9FLAO|nr:TolC family protein [Tamlana laminarinivorans]MCB4797927.1 TolC family protein [Tamlana laminarinivorans]